MKYPLEALGQERFQELCQALLIKAYPRTQCFPVSQADGGRDAVLRAEDSDAFVVFQVKYATGRAPGRPTRTWLINTLRSEAPKLAKLIPRGASEFVLLTNAHTSGALDTGSSDVVSELLGSHLPIPATCWWRDDLERRLDDAWDIKWSFPEALSTYDIVRMMLEAHDRPSASRRASAIKATMSYQLEKDKDVRFKQVDLSNDLLSLFVDVPVATPELPQPRDPQRAAVAWMHQLAQKADGPGQPHVPTLGTATLLLNGSCQLQMPRVILEGAPGQGKSTISQYLCQIHRHHLLNEPLDEERIPLSHRRGPARLPFKVDCRDLDTWLQGGFPFPEAGEPKTTASRSLETFICAQVEQHSGGSPFNVADLHALLHFSPTLLVLDGLDEVANIERRRQVVESIRSGVTRLESVSASLQTLVTSRPTAFSNSPAFPQHKYLYLNLTSKTRSIIDEYTERWLQARDLSDQESSDVRQILASKLDQPHMAELARNPMQLAILLSLIHTRGVSLPDKRTALYDKYVELFLNREAEKSEVVRNNRDLLLQIHRYLAWVLHSEAQTKATQGSVSGTRLRELVGHYLEVEGHETALVADLFSGITERVVALVARVEGTYEFEVQPLREYFAAQHLYCTAPYSPAGHEQRGTLPERFDALSKDFFWQNVTRFYAGCYSQGELPSLFQCLKEMAESDGFSQTGYPQDLAAALLADWTFAQYPILMRDVVAFVLDGIGKRRVASVGRFPLGRPTFALPWKCGGEDLVDRCFAALSEGVPKDYAQILLESVRDNGPKEAVFQRWSAETGDLHGENLTQWISYGLFLGVLDRLKEPELERLLTDDPASAGSRVLLLASGGAFRRPLRSWELKEATTRLLDNPTPGVPSVPEDDLFGRLRRALAPTLFSLAFHFGRRGTLSDHWADSLMGFSPSMVSSAKTALPDTAMAEACERYTLAVEKVAGRFNVAQWRTRIEPWSSVVEAGRREFGDAWVFYLFAFFASSIRSPRESYGEASDLFDQGTELCKRARFARLRAGNSTWWEAQLGRAPDSENQTFALLLFFAWAGPTTLRRIGTLANEMLGSLPEEWWSKIFDALYQPMGFWNRSASRASELDPSAVPLGVGPRFLVLLSRRLKWTTLKELYRRSLKEYDGTDTAVLGFRLEAAFRCAMEDEGSWDEWLGVISKCYRDGATFDGYLLHGARSGVVSWGLELQTAERILRERESYPLQLVGLAERVCRSAAAKNVLPVGRVAERDGWFHQELVD